MRNRLIQIHIHHDELSIQKVKWKIEEIEIENAKPTRQPHDVTKWAGPFVQRTNHWRRILVIDSATRYERERSTFGTWPRDRPRSKGPVRYVCVKQWTSACQRQWWSRKKERKKEEEKEHLIQYWFERDFRRTEISKSIVRTPIFRSKTIFLSNERWWCHLLKLYHQLMVYTLLTFEHWYKRSLLSRRG